MDLAHPKGTFGLATLNNGLRVLTAPFPGARSTICMLMVRSGSRNEARDNCGIAHFFEHMFFKGTRRRPNAIQIAAEIDAVGGETNAFTGKEYTGYYIHLAADKYPLALDILCDMLRNSKFGGKEIGRERGVIQEEMNMYNDSPGALVDALYDRLLFGDSPLGWDIVGTKRTLRAMERQSFLDYRKRWYLPSRLVLGIGGQIGKDVLPEIEALLGGMPPGVREDPIAWTGPIHKKPSVRVRYKETDQANLILGYLGLSRQDPDHYTADVLAAVLGGGMSSRLFSEVRERRGLAYAINCNSCNYTDTGTLRCQAGVDCARVDEATSVIVEEFQKMTAKPVPEAELSKAKECLKGRHTLWLEHLRGLLAFGIEREILDHQITEPAEYLASIDGVTQEDVQRVAQRIIGQPPHLALVGPFRDRTRFENLLG